MRLAAPLLVLSLLSAPALAEPVQLFGRTVELFLPDGYCLLNSSQPNEKLLIDTVTASNQGTSSFVAYFAPCNDLIAFRAGAISVMDEYGLLMVPTPGGQFQPSSQGRAATLQQTADSVPQVDQATLDQIQQQAQTNNQGVQIEGFKFLGLLHRDEAAVYIGVLLELNNGVEKGTATGVVGLTVLGDVAITANLYRPYHSNADIVALTSELVPYMANLVAANP